MPSSRWPTRAALLLVGLPFWTLHGCQSASDESLIRIADLEDRRVPRPEAWESLLTRSDEQTRGRAARAAGRVREPGLAAALRRALAVEESVAVREEQLFALGQLTDSESVDTLLRFLEDGEPRLRARAAEALGKQGVARTVPALVAHLTDRDAAVRGDTLLALARLCGRRNTEREALDPETESALLRGMTALVGDADPQVRWKAACTVAEIEIEGRSDALRRAAASPEDAVRFFAVSGLARAAGGAAGGAEVRPEELLAHIEDANPHVAAAAAAGLGKIGDKETAVVLADLAARSDGAQRRTSPSRWHVCRAALAALAQIVKRVPDAVPIAKTRALAALEDPSLSVQGVAMSLLLATSPERPLPPEWFSRERSSLARVVAVRAVATAPFERVGGLLTQLATDPDAYVASEAIDALVEDAAVAAQRRALAEVARRALASSDVAVAGNAVKLLGAAGSSEDLPALLAAFERLGGDDRTEARTELVHAAVKLGGKSAAELLKRARSDAAPAVAAAAKEEWKKLELTDEVPLSVTSGPPLAKSDGGGRASTIELVAGHDFLSSAPNPRVVLHFAKGDVTLELLREEAPRHVKMLLTRVRSGLCDGLPIHRVVTGFVVQGLDPRGDGWGTGGLFLRDEINRVPYLRGAVGMPNAGPDSGGCQLFISVVPTPHLDGRYTVFALVVGGMDVVDALDLGDLCLKAEVTG